MTVIDPMRPETWVEMDHCQLTQEGQHDVEEKLARAVFETAKLRDEVDVAERRVAYLMSVKLCRHHIVQRGDQYRCSKCNFVWFESTPFS